MSLAVFEEVARAHFSNPPATWQVVPSRRDDPGWCVVDNHGATVDHFRTKSQAEYHRHSGPAAARWHQRTDWYLGYDLHSRTLTGPERLIIADITACDFFGLGSAISSMKRLGTICHESPKGSVIHPHCTGFAPAFTSASHVKSGEYFAPDGQTG